MKAVILTGGKGTRLAPYTSVLPKPLMPLGDMPILEVIVRQLKRARVSDIVLAVGHLSYLLMAFFQNGERFGVRIRYSIENEPLGTAGPLALIPDLEETFITMNGDVLTTLSYRRLVEFHKEQQAVATIAMHQRNVKIDFGVIQCDGDHQIVDYAEKPTQQYSVSMGIYVFEPRVLEYIESDRYLDFPDLIRMLLDSHERVVAYPYGGYWLDIGRPDDYDRAVQEFDKLRPLFLGGGEEESVGSSSQ
jgi:NDP-sugar pyrophosphorylase family protein